MVKRILAVCLTLSDDFKTIVMTIFFLYYFTVVCHIYEFSIGHRYNILQQRTYTENGAIHAFLNCHFRWYVLSLICKKCKT